MVLFYMKSQLLKADVSGSEKNNGIVLLVRKNSIFCDVEIDLTLASHQSVFSKFVVSASDVLRCVTEVHLICNLITFVLRYFYIIFCFYGVIEMLKVLYKHYI